MPKKQLTEAISVDINANIKMGKNYQIKMLS